MRNSILDCLKNHERDSELLWCWLENAASLLSQVHVIWEGRPRSNLVMVSWNSVVVTCPELTPSEQHTGRNSERLWKQNATEHLQQLSASIATGLQRSVLQMMRSKKPQHCHHGSPGDNKLKLSHLSTGWVKPMAHWVPEASWRFVYMPTKRPYLVGLGKTPAAGNHVFHSAFPKSVAHMDHT